MRSSSMRSWLWMAPFPVPCWKTSWTSWSSALELLLKWSRREKSQNNWPAQARISVTLVTVLLFVDCGVHTVHDKLELFPSIVKVLPHNALLSSTVHNTLPDRVRHAFRAGFHESHIILEWASALRALQIVERHFQERAQRRVHGHVLPHADQRRLLRRWAAGRLLLVAFLQFGSQLRGWHNKHFDRFPAVLGQLRALPGLWSGQRDEGAKAVLLKSHNATLEP